MHAPSALEALQAAFQRHLLGQASDFASAVRPGGAIDVARRLGIYHHAYRARLVEALRDVHGHTWRWLGDEAFDTLARVYVEGHPSTQGNLRWYGEDFPDWLARACPEDGEVGELAALDATLRRAFDAADAPVLGLAALAELPPEDWARVTLLWQPACQRLALRHNTLALWHAIDQDGTPPPVQALGEPLQVLVWRVGAQPHFRSLDAVEAEAIDRARAGAGFAAVCEALAARLPPGEAAPRCGALLRRWVEDGALTGLRLA